eukprot:5740934-Prymnesium_polylepis.3
MSPLPSWLCGAQSVALNMSNNDLGVQLHFALFFGSSGYVLKPEGMRRRHRNDEASDDDDQSGGAVMNDEDYWPPPRDMLYRATIDLISLHALPKVKSSHEPRLRLRELAWPQCCHTRLTR